MAIGIDPKETWRYILKADLERSERHKEGTAEREEADRAQTWWILGRLSSQENTEVTDLLSHNSGTGEMRGFARRNYRMVYFGLKGVEESHPLRDAAGLEIPFKARDPKFLDRLVHTDRTELAGAITDKAIPDEALVEKPEPSPGG